MAFLTGGANSAAAATGFAVDNSCRFNDGDSPSLKKTPGSNGSLTTWTLSLWLKRGATGSEISFFSGADPSSTAGRDLIRFDGADTFRIHIDGTAYRVTNRLFRDVSAWYHIVVNWDTTNGTAGSRIKLYVNGVEETSFGTSADPSSGASSNINRATEQRIGQENDGVYYDGYMSEVCFIDGTINGPTDFGEFDADSGIWKPIDVSGLTFGTNGTYLDFKDSANLGNDANGGTDWTEANLAAVDQATDTPTNNFNTLNAVSNPPNGYTLSNGNLEATVSGQSFTRQFIANTIAPSSGKWYWESKLITSGGSDRSRLGICSYEENIGTGTTFPANEVSINTGYSRIRFTENGDGSNGSTTEVDSFYTVPSANDIFMYALDLDNTKYYFGINGVWWNYNTAETGGDPTSGSGYVTNSTNIIKGAMSLLINVYAGAVATTFTNQFNFGSPPYAISSGNADGNGYGNFEYAVPSGYYALNTKNLAEYG